MNNKTSKKFVQYENNLPTVTIYRHGSKLVGTSYSAMACDRTNHYLPERTELQWNPYFVSDISNIETRLEIQFCTSLLNI